MQKMVLKNGKEIEFKIARRENFDGYQIFLEKIAAETIFTNQYVGQPSKSYEKNISSWEKGIDFIVFAFYENEIVGLSMLLPENPNHIWKKYRASFGLMVLKKFWGQKIGSKLMEIIEQKAKEKNIHRIEGFVRANNERGLSFYSYKGYVVEGKLKDRVFINNEWQDEYIIAKIL